jgi:predicted small metal-binding protein
LISEPSRFRKIISFSFLVMFLTLNDRIIHMAVYREFICESMGLGSRCGFEVRAETEEEVMKHAEMHVAKAHGIEGMAEKIKANIKPVKT